MHDAFLTADSQALLREAMLVEVKTENTINRITAMANPRQLERVVPGVAFDMELVFKFFDINNEEEHFDLVQEGLKLVELDALGGGGSRGNGQVKFLDLKWTEVYGPDKGKTEAIELAKVELTPA